MCADFNFYLNRQGIRGPQGSKGDKGDDGKTPVPRTGTNTPIETTVIFDTGDGNSYETPNLKYPIEDRGGNMVMLDRTNSTQYYGTPDQATDNSYGVVKLATPESVLDDPLDTDAVTYELFDDNNQAIKTITDGLAGDITQLNTDLGAEVTNRTNADTQLTNKINTDVGNEATARSNADTALSGRIDNLATSKADKSDVYTKTQTDSLLNNKSNVGHTHNYNDLTNKPTIGNGTITITQGGVAKGTFTTNQSGNSTIDLDQGGGSQLTAGNAINISDDVISVKYDGITIGLNSSGQLQSLVEEPDMNNYYTKSQVDNLIPDVSGFASSIDVGTMFTGTTETKENNVNLDVPNSYQNIAGGVQFEDNKYYLNWAYNMNTGFYAVPKTANETVPIINVCVYKTTSVEDPNTKQTTTTTVPFLYVSDWLNSTGNRSVTAYTQDTYSFGTDTVQSFPADMIDEECYQAIQDMQNAGLNLFYKDSEGKFQKVHSIEPSSATGFYDLYLETIGYNFPLIDSTTGGVNNYTFYMGWQQTAPTVALKVRNTDNYSTSGMTFISINITKTDLDNMLNPTTGVTPDYEWENTRFAQYTDYATTQTAGLVKVGNNLSIAADGTLSADAQAPEAGTGISVSGTTVSVNYDSAKGLVTNGGALGVRVDGTTIDFDSSGNLTANIPTPETVDQTYDATSTHAQSGVAIAGAGFMNGSIVQSPLQYLPDTIDGLTYQNVNTSTMVGSGKGVSTYFAGNTSVGYNIWCGTETGQENLITYTGDKADLISNSSLTWFETELANGFNFACKKVIQSDSTFSYVLGHYENSKFIPDAIFGNDYTRTPVGLYIVSTDTTYYPESATGYGRSDTYSYYLSGLTLTGTMNGSNGSKGTVIVTQADADILNAVTHIRVYVNNYNTTTLALSNIKVINPTNSTPVTDGNATEREATFDNGTNIFDAHPESLSLQYGSDFTVTGGKLALANPVDTTNLVTTNTQQIITGRKDMAIINIQPSGSTGYLNYITPISSGKIAISKSTSYDTAGTQPGVLLEYSGGSSITAVGYGGSGSYINLCTQYGNNTTELRFCNGYKAGQVGSSHAGIGKYGDYTYIRNNNTNDKKIYKITTGGTTSSDFTNFMLEKDMLDGTTISYDSTTGKISAAGEEGVLPVSDDVTEVFTTNYTIIGSPTITSDHIFSTTDAANSLTSIVPFRETSDAVNHSIKFECQFRPTAASHSNGEGILCRDANSDGVRISLNSSTCVRFRTSINGSGVLDVAFSNTPLVQDTLYKLTAEIAAGASSGTGTLYTSSDNGDTWTTAETVTLGTNTPLAIGTGKTSLHYFGVNTPGPTLPFGGEILLDKMFLEEDDVVIWSPVTITGDITEIGKASVSEYGVVKYDGTTIKPDADGKLGVINYLTLPNYADTTNTFDYSSMGTTSQTIPFDGWFVCASNPASNGTRELLINGVVVNGGTRMSGVVPDVSGCYPVKKGDTVQFSGISNATNTYWLAKLIPYRSI